MSLKRLHQVFIAQELLEATGYNLDSTSPPHLFGTGQGSYLVIDPQIEFELPRYERVINRSSLTRLQGLSGVRQGKVRFGLELTGTNAFGTVPQFGLPLRACGFRQEILIKITLPGAITGGPFRHGDLLTQATSQATATIVGDTYDGNLVLWVTKGNGLGNATAFNTTNTISSTSGASAGAPAFVNTNAGYGWWPQSYALSQIRFDTTGLTADVSDGDLLRGVTSGALAQAFGDTAIAASALVRYRRVSGHFDAGEVVENVTTADTDIGTLGTAPMESQVEIPSLSIGLAKDGVRESIQFARGTVSLSGTIGEPMLMQFEFSGGYYAIQDRGNVPGVVFGQTVPPVLIDADMGLGHSGDSYTQEYIPCIRTIGVAMNNEVSYLECMAHESGIFNTHITGRKPTGSFDPDLLPESVFTFMNDFVANTPYRARLNIGSTNGNRFLIKMPALSTTAAPTGDRNGISNRQIAFELTGGSQTISAFNVENELIIIAPYV